MGDGYELKCKRCGFTRDIYDGIGFGCPMVCAEILEEMKKGAFGKHFMEDANNIPHAAVHQERIIFVCDYCGEWREDTVIDLCRLSVNTRNVNEDLALQSIILVASSM